MQKYAVYWPEGGAASQYSVLIGLKNFNKAEQKCNENS
jgi:hypothetical protein